MKYRTKLNNDQVDFIKKEWEKQYLSWKWVNKTDIGLMCKKKFPEEWISKWAWRKRVTRLCPQFEETAHRGNSVNEFINEQWITPRAVKHWRLKQKLDDGTQISAFFRNPSYESMMDDLEESIIESMKNHVPQYPTIKRKKNNTPHLLVIDPADIHLGKLAREFSAGDEYDNQIAIQRCLEGVQWILEKAQGFNIEHILLIGGNDILHVDNKNRTTTRGTPQDTDGMRDENYLLWQKLYVDIMEILMSVADVTFMFCPSNHDETNWWFLCQSLEVWFRDCKHANFLISNKKRKYFSYWKNLIGGTHGDWAKEKDLPIIMSVEAKDLWAQSEHRYWYLHHKHHKIAKDYIGVCLEYLRSQSGTDKRHADKGYIWVPKAIEWFIHHKNFWQVARLTHLFT